MFSEEKLGDEVLLKECAFEVQTDEEQTHGLKYLLHYYAY